MHRLLITPQALQGGTVCVRDQARIHHVRDVLRLKLGETLQCFDGQGWQAQGRLVRCTGQELVIQLEQETRHAPAAGGVTLAAALIRTERFEWLVEKAAELGAVAIFPFVAARSMVRPKADAARRQVARWQRLAEAAAAQCRQTQITRIDALRDFAGLLPQFAAYEHVLLPTLVPPTHSLREALVAVQPTHRVLLLIGPEGDFTPEEAAQALAQGAKAVTLGALTLRAETAGVAALAAVRYHTGRLG